jgi:hypothetical protein
VWRCFRFFAFLLRFDVSANFIVILPTWTVGGPRKPDAIYEVCRKGTVKAPCKLRKEPS